MNTDFIDTHVHFNDSQHPTLEWNWLAPGVLHPTLGDIEEMKHRRYTSEGLRAESRFMRVRKIVHVQAAIGSRDPVDESAWLQAMADETGWPNAIVAYSRLSDPGVGTELERHCEFANVRGIRDYGAERDLMTRDFQRGYKLLAKFGLVHDLGCDLESMPMARELAITFPDTTVVLEHTGFPAERGVEYLGRWRKAMGELAEAENVVCKISGLGMRDPHWSVESLRPWVQGAIEEFGPERCFFGTNWPVDRLYSSYTDLIRAYCELIDELTAAEQEAMLLRNAERVYRI